MIRALALILAATPALAEPMDGPAFDTYVTGKTLSFNLPDGTTFGVEQYLPDRRVIWSATPGECLHGVWFDTPSSICFRYENDETPRCWAVTRTDTGLRADSPGGTTLFEATESDKPLACPGPDLLS